MKILFCGVSVRALIILLLIPCLVWSESGVAGTQKIDRIEQFLRELAKVNYGDMKSSGWITEILSDFCTK